MWNPERCTVFDDSLSACRGAREARMRVVGVYDDYYSGDQKEMGGLLRRLYPQL